MNTSVNSNELVEVTNNMKINTSVDFSSIDKIQNTQNSSFKKQVNDNFTSFLVREYGITMIKNLAKY